MKTATKPKTKPSKSIDENIKTLECLIRLLENIAQKLRGVHDRLTSERDERFNRQVNRLLLGNCIWFFRYGSGEQFQKFWEQCLSIFRD